MLHNPPVCVYSIVDCRLSKLDKQARLRVRPIFVARLLAVLSYLDDLLVGFLLLEVAVEEHGVVGAMGYGIVVLPGHTVVQTPEGHAVYFVALLVEDAHQFLIAISQLLVDLLGKALAIGVEELDELRSLEDGVAERLPDDLSLLRQGQHVDVYLCDHHLHSQGRELVDGILYVLDLGEVEPPVCLYAHTVDADTFGLQHLYEANGSCHFRRAPHVEVVVVEFGIGVAALCRAEGEAYEVVQVLVVFLPSLVVPVVAIFVEYLIDYVPGIDLAGKVRGDLLQILHQMGPHVLLRARCTVGVEPEEVGCLVVPNKCVAQRFQSVLCGELTVGIAWGEVPAVGCRVYVLGFEYALWRYGIELLQDERLCLAVVLTDDALIDGTSDKEVVLEGVLECDLLYFLGGLAARDGYGGKGKRDGVEILLHGLIVN